eukprot:5034833-Amphidinium_carterae.1
MWKEPSPQRFKLESHWGYGLWLGRAAESEEHIVGSRVGVLRVRMVRRLAEQESANLQLMLAMVGVPWDTKARHSTAPAADVHVAAGQPMPAMSSHDTPDAGGVLEREIRTEPEEESNPPNTQDPSISPKWCSRQAPRHQ